MEFLDEYADVIAIGVSAYALSDPSKGVELAKFIDSNQEKINETAENVRELLWLLESHMKD